MKQSEARKQLETVLFAAQKYRSVATEKVGLKDGDKLAENLFPWLFGDKSILIPLSRMLDRADGFTVQEYFNILVILDRFLPTLKVYIAAQHGVDIPEPDITLISSGFEEE